MSSYAEQEQDAREYAELKAQFEAEKQDELDAERKAKPVVHMNEIMEHRFKQRELENAERHMKAQEYWSDFLEKTNNGEDFERSEAQEEILEEIRFVVKNNIVYGTPPYSLESAEEILLDIINDLTSLKERLSFMGI